MGMGIYAQRFLHNPDGKIIPFVRETFLPFERQNFMFATRTAAVLANHQAPIEAVAANFRTPADPEAGWAARNPDRAMLFLFVTPRDCGALEELMAI
jgi:hypothetical protein